MAGRLRVSDDIDDILFKVAEEFHGAEHITHCLKYLKGKGFQNVIVIGCVQDPQTGFAGDFFGEKEHMELMVSAVYPNLKTKGEADV